MERAHRILLVHSESEWVAALRRELGEQLVTVGTVGEAWTAIGEQHPELVVAEDRVGAGFLEELTRRSPGTPRAILLNGGDRRPWLEASAEGHRFAAIPEHAPDLAARLVGLLRADVAAVAGMSGCTVEAAAPGRRALVSGPLLQLTSESLAFRLEPGDGLEAFLPGRELEQVTVRRGRDTLLAGCAAEVRKLVPDDNGGFEVEVALGPPPAPAPAEEVVRDPLQRATLLAEAIRRGRLSVEGLDGTPPKAPARGRVDVLAELLLVEGLPAAFTPGLAVRFFFEAGGAHYRFVSALTEPGITTSRPALAATIPQELRGRRRRRARIHLEGLSAEAEVTPVLSAETIRRPVIDVEMEGMAFLAQPGDLLPVGTRLRSIGVGLGGGIALQASGRIASRAPAQGPSGPAVRCGVHFDPLGQKEQSSLAAAILRHAHPGLELARGLTFDAFWAFLRETGFLYPEKEEKIRAVLPEVHRSLTALFGAPDGPLRTLLFRSSGLLGGHVSVLKPYRSTWMVQHLATRKDGPGSLAAARALNVGVVDYMDQLPDCEWTRVWFRPNNRWPARTFGRFARLQFDPHRCDLRTYAYLVAPTEGAPSPAVGGVVVSPARPSDWAELRRYLVTAGQTASLAAEDLCQAPDLTEAAEPFRALGLERRREALVARRHGRLAAFALLEISSLGLNLSELTNAFRLHALDRAPEVTAVLLARARQRYAELGRGMAIGLAENPDLAAWGAAGFSHLKSYSCWTVQRQFFRRYVEFIQRLYEHLPVREVRARA